MAFDSEAKLDNADSGYLNGRYESAVKVLTDAAKAKAEKDKKRSSIRTATNPPAKGKGGDTTTDTDDRPKSVQARDSLREHSENAWEKPLEQTTKLTA